MCKRLPGGWISGTALAIAVFAAPGPLWSQPFNRHSITISPGVARPRGELQSWFTDAPLVGVQYGFRLHRNFQIEAGFDGAFGAADVRDFLPTEFGELRIRDYQTFVPFGGRTILPLASERVHIYGGLGGAYMRYSEGIRQPFEEDSGFRIPCDVCARRDGFGYYGIAGVDTSFFDSARRFRLGAGVRMYRGRTSGDRFGIAPPRETTDRWLNLFASFSVTF